MNGRLGFRAKNEDNYMRSENDKARRDDIKKG
jgi:hypothetical protein